MKIYDKSQDEYLQAQQVIIEICMDIHIPRSQELLPKILASCFLALVPALTRIKVTVFGNNNSAERGTVFTSSDYMHHRKTYMNIIVKRHVYYFFSKLGLVNRIH